jgi:hypothetical protein
MLGQFRRTHTQKSGGITAEGRKSAYEFAEFHQPDRSRYTAHGHKLRILLQAKIIPSSANAGGQNPPAARIKPAKRVS